MLRLMVASIVTIVFTTVLDWLLYLTVLYVPYSLDMTDLYSM